MKKRVFAYVIYIVFIVDMWDKVPPPKRARRG